MEQNTKTIVSEEWTREIDAMLTKMSKIPCEYPDRRNCWDEQLKPGRGKGWHQCDARKMCAPCACYWHLACAMNFTLGVVR